MYLYASQSTQKVKERMLLNHISHSMGQNSHTVFKTLFHFHHPPPPPYTHTCIPHAHTHTTEQVARLFPTHLLQHYRVWHRSVLQTGGSCWWSALPLNNQPPPGKHKQYIKYVIPPHTHKSRPKKKKKKKKANVAGSHLHCNPRLWQM